MGHLRIAKMVPMPEPVEAAPAGSTVAPERNASLAAAPRSTIAATMPTPQEMLKRRNPPPAGWRSWWPVAVGVALACLAPVLQPLLIAQWDPWGMRVVFPFALLSGLRETGFDDELRRTLPQLLLLLQFPLEGLLTKFNLARGTRLSAAIRQLVFLHAICVLVLWLVADGTALK